MHRRGRSGSLPGGSSQRSGVHRLAVAGLFGSVGRGVRRGGGVPRRGCGVDAHRSAAPPADPSASTGARTQPAVSGAHGHGAAGVEAVAARDSAIHRLDPRAKIVCLILVAVVAASTPAGAWSALLVQLGVVVAVAVVARLPLRYTLRRMVIEVPFLVAALVLVVVAGDGGVRGLTLALKLTTSVVAMIVLSSTTPFPRLLHGFEALRTPRVIVLIVSFMWRYLHVLGEEWHRMRIARQARGHTARWLWQEWSLGPVVAALFLRSLSRGERVYLAMASRGFVGTAPATTMTPLSLDAADAMFAAALTAAVIAARTVLV
ncbi:MAG: cobalt ECF transporter T component CbiQ [Nitriliruptorales bacterium]|nr:cobalt ECF transporter T component CbiQ [Nitriliruptorales bacterium]